MSVSPLPELTLILVFGREPGSWTRGPTAKLPGPGGVYLAHVGPDAHGDVVAHMPEKH